MRDRGERHKFGVKNLYNAANLKRACSLQYGTMRKQYFIFKLLFFKKQ